MNITSTFINYKLWETIKIQLYGRKELKNCTGRLSGNNLKSGNAYAKQCVCVCVLDVASTRSIRIFCSRMHTHSHIHTSSFFFISGLSIGAKLLSTDWRENVSVFSRAVVATTTTSSAWRPSLPLPSPLENARIWNANWRKSNGTADDRLHFVLFCSSFRLIKSIWKWLHMHTK